MSKIVTHFIAGFPSFEESLEVARTLIDSGAFALEMQIPFSDPNADGSVIEAACRKALEANCSSNEAFQLLRTIRSESEIPIFVMSYASLVVTPGVENFVRSAKEAGANGLIIPDLTPGSDENLYRIAAQWGCPAVPVVVPWISDERLKEVLSEPIEWLYVALRSGITGTYTELGSQQVAFLAKIREYSVSLSPHKRVKIMAGFGIQDASQVKTVAEVADAVIVGSAIVNAISTSGFLGVRRILEELLTDE